MARRTTPTEPVRPHQSIEEKRRGISRIKRRIEELNAFDPSTVTSRLSDPRVTSIETAISSTLAAVFGEKTAEYRRYINAATLDNGPISMRSDWVSARRGGYDDRQLREAVQYLSEGKAQSIALLQQAINALEEEIEFSTPEITQSGSDHDSFGMEKTRSVFVVHGHDEGSRESVARFLEKLGFVPIILHEQANRGRTIIEKVEENGDVSFAVILLTPDDKVFNTGDIVEVRARQNVILELGYFIGRLGREKVCALRKGDVSIPSDFAGVVWEAMDDAGGWKQALARELESAGHDIDWNKAMRA